MENGEPQKRLRFIILAVALADGLIVGGALFFVWWMATRGASGGPAAPTPVPGTGGNTPGSLIWLPLLLALLMPLTTLPVILLLRKRATGGPQTTDGTHATMDRLIAALGGTAGARPEGAGGSSQQNRTFVLLVAAMGIMLLLLALAVLYILVLQAR